MPERNAIEMLDQIVEAILAGRTPAVLDPEVAMLAAVAADLRDLPDPAFKARLRNQLVPEKEEAMPTLTLPNLKPGFHSITPYLVVEGADREIATEMGKTEGAVKQLQWRGLQTLRSQIGQSHA